MSEGGDTVSTVYLVGAGPGDPDLITVKGLDLLERCDVLVYDALVSAELVARCPAREKHYVGKTAGGHAMTQERITALLVELATVSDRPRTIVRLKGGDPYVFGRGGEEALACLQAGVPVEVVPGVTAGVAASAYAGVPVTHRSISRGVIMATGHKVDGGLPDLPFEAMASSGMTLVFYMGVATLPAIAEELTRHGLDPATPAMVVQEGTLPGQRSVTASLEEIAARARGADIRPPAITVIGDVVGLGSQLATQRPRPLAGKTVVVVRAEERHYPELERLRLTGARVFDVPGIRCVPRDDDAPVAEMLDAVRDEHLVVFTSALAARFFGELWVARHPDEASRPQPTFVAASRAFLSTLQRHGMTAAFAPEVTGAGRVLEALRGHGVQPGRVVWLPRSAAADRELPHTLAAAGYDARAVQLYDTLSVPIPADVCSMLAGGRVDALVLLSGTCVTSVVEAVPQLTRSGGGRTVVAAIGAKTAAAARELGLPPDRVPPRPTMPALVDEVIAALTAEEGENAG